MAGGRHRIVSTGPSLVLLALSAWVVAGCNGPMLSVDLRTDLVPGREFVRVETTIAEPFAGDAGPTEVGQTIAQNVSPRSDYLAGVRIVEIGAARGAYQLRVNVFDAAHTLLATRRVDVTVNGHTSVTVVVTRNCIGVTCPPDGDPSLTECVDQQCVDPRCSPATPSLCPSAALHCANDGDCVAEGCGHAVCASGACLVAPDDDRCGSGEICWGDLTCIPAPPDGDAGVSPFPEGDGSIDDSIDDAGPGTTAEICTNGVDDDANGLVDCADPGCATAGCNDSNRCTYADRCALGVCRGTTIHCQETSICPGNTCQGTRRCRRLPAPAGTACGDGVNPQPCNGDYCDGAGHCQLRQRRPDGASCGTGEFHCCAGLCVDLTSDEGNCGGCNVRCASGASCARVPTTNFGACTCTADGQCAIYGADAWCDGAGQCQCGCGCPHTDSGSCTMHCEGACGTSLATCADVSGQDNFCYYPTS